MTQVYLAGELGVKQLVEAHQGWVDISNLVWYNKGVNKKSEYFLILFLTYITNKNIYLSVIREKRYEERSIPFFLFFALATALAKGE